jgi:hypothetical protein
MAERRSVQRFPVDLPGQVDWGGRRQTAQLLDVGVGGAFLALSGPLPVGTVCTVKFQLGRAAIVVRVVVRWVRSDGQPGSGVEFLDLCAEHRALISSPGGTSPGACQVDPRINISFAPDRPRLGITVGGALGPVAELLSRQLALTVPKGDEGFDLLFDALHYDLVSEQEAQTAIVEFLKLLGRQRARHSAFVLPASAIASVQLLRLIRAAGLADEVFCAGTRTQAETFLDRAAPPAPPLAQAAQEVRCRQA